MRTRRAGRGGKSRRRERWTTSKVCERNWVRSTPLFSLPPFFPTDQLTYNPSSSCLPSRPQNHCRIRQPFYARRRPYRHCREDEADRPPNEGVKEGAGGVCGKAGRAAGRVLEWAATRTLLAAFSPLRTSNADASPSRQHLASTSTLLSTQLDTFASQIASLAFASSTADSQSASFRNLVESTCAELFASLQERGAVVEEEQKRRADGLEASLQQHAQQVSFSPTILLPFPFTDSSPSQVTAALEELVNPVRLLQQESSTTLQADEQLLVSLRERDATALANEVRFPALRSLHDAHPLPCRTLASSMSSPPCAPPSLRNDPPYEAKKKRSSLECRNNSPLLPLVVFRLCKRRLRSSRGRLRR
jgi:hypothetical protein